MAYALVVKKALSKEGLKDGQDYTMKPTGGTFMRLGLMNENKEHAATMLNPPFSITAAREGFQSLGMAVSSRGALSGDGLLGSA